MFIQVIQGKCFRHHDMRGAIEEWRDERAPDVVGWLGGTYGFTEDDVFVAVVRFASREDARQNTETREHSEWWARTRRLFAGEPVFHNCSQVAFAVDDGFDEARFVQVIQGRADDPDHLESLAAEMQELLDERPEVIGATLAVDEDGTFTETVAFTDEASARRGAPQNALTDVRATVSPSTAELRYLDLREPWFASRWG
ncbi:hypothetical protein [Mumia sp. Pv 4-285]|uniref:hypothetical protein n=1 Tax=Mumia qirimensis TaxID=3234852 RepID=UPI00351CC120